MNSSDHARSNSWYTVISSRCFLVGSGKTLVSILLIIDDAGGLDRDKSNRSTMFVAPKVLLVQQIYIPVLQQAEVLQKHSDVHVAIYCGDMNVDFWNRRWCNKIWWSSCVGHDCPDPAQHSAHAFLKIMHINLLVCDECHRAVKKGPYNCIVQEFYHDHATVGQRPHVFGMTASPVNIAAKPTWMKVSEAVCPAGA